MRLSETQCQPSDLNEILSISSLLQYCIRHLFFSQLLHICARTAGIYIYTTFKNYLYQTFRANIKK